MKTLFTLSLFLFTSSALAKPTAIFLDTDHCVAWKARKVMALIKTVEPVGKNCKIETKFQKQKDQTLVFSGTFPVKAFDSKEEDRDEEVAKILKSDQHPNITFVSQSMTVTDWKEILEKKEGIITGTLTVAGKKRLIEPKVLVTANGPNFRFSSKIITNYSFFGIEPPSVAGGLVAKAKDYLEFHLHLQSEKLSGFDLIK